MSAESLVVLGAGYVGLVTAAFLIEQGHSVRVVEPNDERRHALERGECPFVEPGLLPLVRQAVLMANRLISRITGTQLHDYGCTLKAYDGELMSHLHLYGEQHRFIPALAGLAGARVAEIPVNHRTRLRGTSNYGISRTVRVLLDLMTVKFLLKYLARPMQFFGLLGLASFLLGLGVLGFLGIDKVVTGSGIADRPLLILGVLLTVLGVQFVSMGLLGELMIRVYHEVGRRTPYVVRATAGLRAHTEELEFPLVMPSNGSRPPTAGTTTTADQTSHSAGSAPGRS